MRRIIIWEKWAHPLGGGPEWGGGEPGVEGPTPAPVRPILLTAAGVIPATPYADMAAAFDLRVAHTSFPVSEEHLHAVNGVPGVEALDVLTPYRFRLAVGRAFEAEGVLRSVEEALGVGPGREHLPPSALRQVEVIEEVLSGRYAYWALYVLPNLAIDQFGTDDRAEFRRRYELYDRACQGAGGVVIASHGH